jgi:hypothetical protein
MSVGVARLLLVAGLVPGSRTERVAWRMVGANNRPIARGVTGHLDEFTCLRAIASFQRSAADLRLVIGVAPGGGLWIWRAELAGEVVAVSARAYQRHVEAASNGELFRQLLPNAVPRAGGPRFVHDLALAGRPTG